METQRFIRNGHEYEMRVEPDRNHGAPWDEEDGHGTVSNWTRRSKAAGELVLCEDRGYFRYYDFAESCRIARRDGWGFLPAPLQLEYAPGDHAPYARRGGRATCAGFAAEDPEDVNRAIRAVYDHFRSAMTSKEYAAQAAMRDFHRLRAWCNDDWSYVGVIVAHVCPCCGRAVESRAASLWGIESDSGDYLQEVAEELADEIGAPPARPAD